MAHFMGRFDEHAYAVMRIVSGFLFFWHGTQKLLSFPGEVSAGAPAHVAGPLELLGGVLLMRGLFTRWSAFICSGLMAFAYWLAHGTKAILPIVNGGELAALYCFVFLFIAAHGPGIWSVDRVR